MSVLVRVWSLAKHHLRTKERVAAVVAVISLLAYSTLYVAYFQFYLYFGLRPSDVGFDKLRLLQESLVGPLLLPVGLMLAYWPIPVLAVVNVALSAGVTGICRGLKWNAAKEALAAVALTTVVLWSVGTVLSFGFVVLRANQAGQEVFRDGQIYTSIVFPSMSSDVNLPLLDVVALPVSVRSTDGSALANVPTECLLYLGRNDGRYVLYDVKNEQVLFVGVDGARVVVAPNASNYVDQRLPPACAVHEGLGHV